MTQTSTPQFTLCITEDSFVIANNGTDKNHLIITRKDGSVVQQQGQPSDSIITTNTQQQIYGLLGSIQLLSGRYLAVITDVESIGVIFHTHQVYKILSVAWLPYNNNNNNMDNNSDEVRFLNLLDSMVNKHNKPHSSFYYCHTYDLTRNVQSNVKTSNTIENQDVDSLYKHVDDHFLWNHYLAGDLLRAKAHNWTVPIIRGFVEVKNVSLDNGKSFKFSIVSRLGHKRVGTRYFTRGIDVEGNAANYVETEQIVETDRDLLSFVQIRGSIPVHWSQKPCLKYTPKIKISEKKDNSAGFKRHLDTQLQRYENVVMVNLVKATGSENVLAQAFEKETNKYNSKNVQYHHFDFHAKHKKLSHKAIEELVSLVENKIQDFGYFAYDLANNSVKSRQGGIVRVNCIDCLDRTNVAESVFANHILVRQLRKLELLGSNETTKDHALLDKIFRNTWANNGDALSNLYAGTGALKADITRTGKRTLVGLYNDGSNSVTRYYLNNFSDGCKLDATNLFLGKYVIDPQSESPFKNNRVLNELAMFLMLVWLFITYMMWLVLGKDGRSLVNNPALKKRKAVVDKLTQGTDKKEVHANK